MEGKNIENQNFTFELETDRLILRPISPDDAGAMFENFTGEIAIHMFPQPSGDIENTQKFIEESIKENEAGTNIGGYPFR